MENLNDLLPGMVLEGAVTNVTNFGAFVDIGVHQDGLVHISSLSYKFERHGRRAGRGLWQKTLTFVRARAFQPWTRVDKGLNLRPPTLFALRRAEISCRKFENPSPSATLKTRLHKNTPGCGTQFVMETITALLDKIYADTFPQAARQRLLSHIAVAHGAIKLPRKAHWDKQDVVLITYADQFHESGMPTLQSFSRFFQQHLHAAFSLVHLLPFSPYSSDDGFSVIDYHQVDPLCGTWPDVATLHQETRLMFDFVCNHMSS
nr:sucrose phosphorylase [Candidatus Pantoea persica]